MALQDRALVVDSKRRAKLRAQFPQKSRGFSPAIPRRDLAITSLWARRSRLQF
jgi:hypothetical protein